MNKALNLVQSGGMSINQAAILHNLPYSSLYGRINRWKKEHEEKTQDVNPTTTNLATLMPYLMAVQQQQQQQQQKPVSNSFQQ